MRTTAFHARDFLSFEQLSWTNVGADLSVIVGPNGAGKSNLLVRIQ